MRHHMMLTQEVTKVTHVLSSVDDSLDLRAKSEYPGLAVEFSIDGGDWTEYSSPVPVTPGNVVQLRTRSHDGSRYSLIRTLEVSTSGASILGINVLVMLLAVFIKLC